jgi:hypothetical protein
MGGNIQRDLREIGWDDMDWIHLTWDRDKCLDLVNKVMNCGSFKCWDFWLTEGLLGFSEGLCCMELLNSIG